MSDNGVGKSILAEMNCGYSRRLLTDSLHVGGLQYGLLYPGPILYPETAYFTRGIHRPLESQYGLLYPGSLL